jgi:hypothetical protein
VLRVIIAQKQYMIWWMKTTQYAWLIIWMVLFFSIHAKFISVYYRFARNIVLLERWKNWLNIWEMSEDKGVGLQEMFSEKLSLSPFRSHLSQHVVPPSLYCSRKECKEMTSIFEQSSEHNSCAGCLAWLWLGTMILLIAAGFWMIIRCCLKLRYMLTG